MKSELEIKEKLKQIQKGLSKLKKESHAKCFQSEFYRNNIAFICWVLEISYEEEDCSQNKKIINEEVVRDCVDWTMQNLLLAKHKTNDEIVDDYFKTNENSIILKNAKKIKQNEA